MKFMWMWMIISISTHVHGDFLHRCFEDYGDCLESEQIVLPIMNACIQVHTTESECSELYLTNCGIFMGCNVPYVCESIPTPWCEQKSILEIESL